MRADGRKNRQAILHAASKIFAAHGFNAPLELVAVEAGVSRATLYRNFDNREQLGLAIFDSNVAELDLHAERLKNKPDGFTELLVIVMEYFVRDAGLSEAITQPASVQHIAEISVRLLDIIEPLAEQAKQQNKIKADYSREDLELTLGIFGAVLPKGDPKLRNAMGQRLLEIVFNGILVNKPSEPNG